MTSARFTHDIGDLADDLETIARTAHRDMRGTVRQALIVGNTVARDNARRSSGRHGKLYPRAFGWDLSASAPGSTIAGEYGPDEGLPQGGMSFEDGSVNQPAHHDLAQSADLIGQSLAGETRDLTDNWFWPR